MSEARLLRAKHEQELLVKERKKRGAESSDNVPKTIPKVGSLQSESGFPVAKPEDHPYYHLAKSVVEYVFAQREKSPEEWPRLAATSKFRDTHRLINKEGTQQRRAYDAAIRQLAANSRLAKKPQQLEARLRFLLESRPSLKTLKKV